MYKDYPDEDLWNLDKTICKFVIPRLKEFRIQSIGFPMDVEPEEWSQILDKMIEAFELASTYDILNKRDNKKVEDGLLLFAKYFQYLWW